MKVSLKPGCYVLAVSGGVDSMVLLDLLAKEPDLELIVAHFNHGIRPDSSKDEELVVAIAKRLKRPFEAGHGRLDSHASEEKARDARYKFLKAVKRKYGAVAIVTAHHQDDMIETAVLNLLRGTGYRGFTAISTNKEVVRPLLGYTKKEIYLYANANQLEWREDDTNRKNDYLRNYVRNRLLRKLTGEQRKRIILNIDKVANIQEILNPEIAKLSHIIYHQKIIDRGKFSGLPINLGNELVIYWLRQNDMLNYDKKTVERINAALRTSRSGTIIPVKQSLRLEVGSKSARFSNTL